MADLCKMLGHDGSVGAGALGRDEDALDVSFGAAPNPGCLACQARGRRRKVSCARSLPEGDSMMVYVWLAA